MDHAVAMRHRNTLTLYSAVQLSFKHGNILDSLLPCPRRGNLNRSRSRCRLMHCDSGLETIAAMTFEELRRGAFPSNPPTYRRLYPRDNSFATQSGMKTSAGFA